MLHSFNLSSSSSFSTLIDFFLFISLCFLSCLSSLSPKSVFVLLTSFNAFYIFVLYYFVKAFKDFISILHFVFSLCLFVPSLSLSLSISLSIRALNCCLLEQVLKRQVLVRSRRKRAKTKQQATAT